MKSALKIVQTQEGTLATETNIDGTDCLKYQITPNIHRSYNR